MTASLKATAQVGWRLAKAAVGRDVSHRADVKLPTEWFGSAYGGWVVYTRPMSSDSIVYSCGVGEDASFDLALISRFEMTIHAFDPTPKAVDWVGAQDLPPSFMFHPLGIASFDGAATFNAPPRPQDASYTLVQGRGNATVTVQADVRRVSTVMTQLGHDRIDLLKMDIEGAEYDVIEDLVASQLDIRQLLVEFHHSFETIGVEETYRSVALLRSRGFKLYYVSPRGEEYSFVHTNHF